jgi:ribosome-associated protein
MQEIKITGDTIRLGQLLKLGGVVESGAGGKDLLATEAVHVNAAVETRRGRQLHDGDVVEVGEWEFRISAAQRAGRPAGRPAEDSP